MTYEYKVFQTIVAGGSEEEELNKLAEEGYRVIAFNSTKPPEHNSPFFDEQH